jgi:hypothetical protein
VPGEEHDDAVRADQRESADLRCRASSGLPFVISPSRSSAIVSVCGSRQRIFAEVDFAATMSGDAG